LIALRLSALDQAIRYTKVLDPQAASRANEVKKNLDNEKELFYF
jgi:hypothetical protein